MSEPSNQTGASERLTAEEAQAMLDADEFIRDCVFNAWWDWDYEGPQDG